MLHLFVISLRDIVVLVPSGILFAHCLDSCQVACAPPGTQAATLDIEAAYRTIPVWPKHKCFLVVEVDGSLFIDHIFPFGLSTAGGIQGNVADATVDILTCSNLGPIKKWVDDHTLFRYAISGGLLLPDGSTSPFIYNHGLIEIYAESEPLGVPWHPLKWRDFASLFIYLGLLWDLISHTVTLPNEKREKYLRKLTSLLSHLAAGGRISLKDAMSINGTLSHVTFVIPRGRSYLGNLSTFISSFPSRFSSRYPPPSVVSDLKWWFNTLSSPPIPRDLVPRGSPQDLNLWVDASTDWGIGLTLSEKWNTWTLVSGWKGQGRDIGWLEAVAVELAILTLFDLGWKNACILVHSDNQGVIGAFTRGRSRNFHVNLCIRRSEAIAMCSNVAHVLSYVESARNKADVISRGEVGSHTLRLPLVSLPVELQPFITPYA